VILTDLWVAKLEDVTKLMDKLSSDLQKINLLPHRACSSTLFSSLPLTLVERDALLEQLKVYGRDPANSDPIFTKQEGCIYSTTWSTANMCEGYRNVDSTCLQ
jgi:hypothetical protein